MLSWPGSAMAQASTPSAIGAEEIVILAALIGTVSFAVMSAIALIRARNRTEVENTRLVREAANLRAAADRAESIINADVQRVVVWETPGDSPVVVGDLHSISGVPSDPSRFVAFGSWLSPESASALDKAVDLLRAKGEPFTMSLATSGGTELEAVGRTAGSRAAVRFRDLTRDRLALARLKTEHQTLASELAAIKATLDDSRLLVWIRDTSGRLAWVNRAYCVAVDAVDRAEVLRDSAELIDQAGRDAIAKKHLSSSEFYQRLSVVAAGRRLVFDITDVVSDSGSAGLAVDATEIEASEASLKRLVDFHARTLDQLATAVAVVGPDRRLRSYNAAFRALFGLDAGFLDLHPDEGALLDQLRATRKIPEQADFRTWKDDLLSAYQAVEAREYMWHLPEGVTLRVIANPHPEGGVTWIYENVTERLDLESRYNALIRVQGETLNHLKEGVAVFGSNGLLRLHNPAFTGIWGLDEGAVSPRTHIAAIAEICRKNLGADKEWERLTTSIAGVDETRASVSGRMDRNDNRVIDFATMPLPEGQVMVTFVDISDTVHVERALLDRNDALEAADRLKNEFIQHVSYELRSPLTNMIGFTQLLADPNIGPLNEKQHEYVGYVMTSGQSLLTIVNDILDLATIDAGIMELDLAEVDLGQAVESAIDGLRGRLTERGITLDKRISSSIGTLVADERRLRQILYNLISNAIGFSSQGGHVSVVAERSGDSILLVVDDEGVGIPDDFVGLVFDRFESRAGGAERGGVGLGLAIVKSFVELHGGDVSIDSLRNKGTTVRVRLPIRPESIGIAAE
ncbi:MAG: ATP-binding protein [Alphaproteobacteria bacterium]